MKYCPYCRRINEGWPIICRFCGRTWGVRICRRGHFNPAGADYCGECGSADLSTTTNGGKILNWLFRAPGHIGALKRLFVLIIPLLLIVVGIASPGGLVGVIIAITVTVFLVQWTIGLVPNWLKSFVAWFIRSLSHSENSRN